MITNHCSSIRSENYLTNYSAAITGYDNPARELRLSLLLEFYDLVFKNPENNKELNDIVDYLNNNY